MDTVDFAMVAPLPEPFAQHAWNRWVRRYRGVSAETYAAFLRAVRSLSDELDSEFAGIEITSGLLRKRVGVSTSTLTDWQQRGLLRRTRYNHPDYAQAVAILIMRRLFPDKQRNWLPAFVSTPPDGPTWWCYDLDMKHHIWYQAVVYAMPLGLRVTPWNGAVRYGWHPLPGGGAMDLSGVLPQYMHLATEHLAAIRADMGITNPS